MHRLQHGTVQDATGELTQHLQVSALPPSCRHIRRLEPLRANTLCSAHQDMSACVHVAVARYFKLVARAATS